MHRRAKPSATLGAGPVFAGLVLMLFLAVFPRAPAQARALSEEDLLQRAEQASATHGEVDPGHDQILSAYRKVTRMNPRNKAARQALAEIAWRYAELIEQAEADGEEQRAEELAQRIRTRLNDTLWRTRLYAGRGDSRAQLALGVFYRRGILVAADPGEACAAYGQASQQQVAPAMFRYALCLEPDRPAEAQRLLQQAAEGGSEAARQRLASPPPRTRTVHEDAAAAKPKRTASVPDQPAPKPPAAPTDRTPRAAVPAPSSATATQTSPLTQSQRPGPDEAKKYRRIVKGDTRNEAARQALAEIAWRYAKLIEQAESKEQMQWVSYYRERIEKQLYDVWWRTNNRSGKGYPAAILAEAVFYRHGILTEPDPVKACESYRRASAHGLDDAVFRYGLCVNTSQPEESRRLVRVAAEHGHAAAQHVLAEYYLRGNPPNPREAAVWARRAAEQGRPSAQSLLAWLYTRGLGVEKDLFEAERLYRLAAGNGDLAAQNNLGEIYENGNGLPADPMRAAEWYSRAAAQGFGPAQFNLGRLYASGAGVESDDCRALGWFRKAASQGLAPAREAIDWMDQQGRRCPTMP